MIHITQNVDGLCGKAIAEVESRLGESSDSELIEMHGRLFDVACTAHDCDYQEYKPESPICPALGGTELTVAEGDLEPVVRRAELPHCPKCGQLLRPDVVWFGERPKRIHEILDIADQVDLCLVVGTSALVLFALQYKSHSTRF
jgi:NAD-dependent deacetylase sirtuin 5